MSRLVPHPEYKGWQVCAECASPHASDAFDCANPACWPGMAAYRQAVNVWQDERTAWMADAVERGRKMGSTPLPNALREIFERHHPAPVADDFRRDR